MFTFIDAFSGLGGFRIALEKLGGTCIGSIEIKKTALSVYDKNWQNNSHFGDIKKIDTLPDHDFFVGGVPCQAWSNAGKNRGFDDPRGALWKDVIRLVLKHKPKAFLFENVKGLVEPRHFSALEYLLKSFDGYDVHYQVLNSCSFGVSQSRERIYIAGVRKDCLKNNFKWSFQAIPPKPLYQVLNLSADVNTSCPEHFVLSDIRNGDATIHSWDILETTVRQKTICLEILKKRRSFENSPIKDASPVPLDTLKMFIPNLEKSELEDLISMGILREPIPFQYEFVNSKQNEGIGGIYRVYMPHTTTFPTLTAMGVKDVVSTVNISGQKKNNNYKSNFIEQVLKNKNYRFLKDRDLALLQGFPPSYVLSPISEINTELFGNSVTVPVISAVAQCVLNTGCFV